MLFFTCIDFYSYGFTNFFLYIRFIDFFCLFIPIFILIKLSLVKNNYNFVYGTVDE